MKHFYENIKGWFAFKAQYEQVFKELPEHSVWVEIGSFHGRSLCWLMVESENCNKHFKVHAVDRWDGDPLSPIANKFNEGAYKSFLKNLEQFIDKITVHRKTSWDAAEDFKNESIDYAMIDAGHDYESVKKDIEAWWPKIKKGGMIGGDDYGLDPTDGVYKAVNEFVQKQNLTFELLQSYKKNGNISKKAKNWLIRKK